MGAGEDAPDVTIPSWFMRRSQGLAMRDYYTAHPGETSAQFTYAPQVTPNIGDVMASFSSTGPTQDKTIKPDVVAPGVDVVSSGYAGGPFPESFTGFGSSSGTSMATPHVAGAAALLLDLHPRWSPDQVKSALMTTANENVFLDTALTRPAGVLNQGSGRIDLAAAANPSLTLDTPSLSAGELAAGETVALTIHAHSELHRRSIWQVTTTGDGLTFEPSTSTLTVFTSRTVPLDIKVGTAADAEPGDYTGAVVLTNVETGQRLHVPVWLGVRPEPTKDVLLVDDDGSGFGPFPDYAATYRSALDALGVNYDYLDVDEEFFPTAIELYDYRAVIVFTGDNDSFDTSGFFPEDQTALEQWLDSGGRLWMTGQNLGEESDSNVDFDSPHLGRARLYHGYLGLLYETGGVYPDAAPAPTATGSGFMGGLDLDLGANGDGIDNQTSIEATSPMPNTDTFQAADTMTPLFQLLDTSAPFGSAIAFSRGSEPSLEEERVMYHYRSVSMGFGLEGVNGAPEQQEIAHRTLDWLLDEVDVSLTAVRVGTSRRVLGFTADATSSTGAGITSYRWDFGDGSPIVLTGAPNIEHRYVSTRASRRACGGHRRARSPFDCPHRRQALTPPLEPA